MSLHLRLKQLRKLRKLNHLQMAEQLHMSRSNYTKMESNAGSIRIELLQRIAAVLRVPASLLVSAQAGPTASTPWNDFDMMLELAYEQLSGKLEVVPFDELTLEQLALVTSRGFGTRESYENTPHRGRLYSTGPRQLFAEMMHGLGYSTLFEHHLVEHPTWLQRWGMYTLFEASRAVVRALPLEQQKAVEEPAELDEQAYVVVYMLVLTMEDLSEQFLELAQRDIPEGMDIEQALQQLIQSRGALDGEILCFSYDGYTCTQDIVTDIYAS